VRRRMREGPGESLPASRVVRSAPFYACCENPPRKIPYYHLNHPLWSLSNNKVSFCR
jgi:hypothetical protein